MNNTGLCSILMNGEEISLLFGMPACEYFQSKIADGSVLVDDEGNTIGNTSLAFLVHAGYWNHCIANGHTPKRKIGDFIEWIENAIDVGSSQQELVTAAECFRDSRSLEKLKVRTEKVIDEIKKKTAELTGKKSSLSVTENSE